MSRRRMSEMIPLVAGLLAAIAPAIPLLWPQHKLLAWLAAPCLFWAARTLYDHWPRFYLFVRRTSLRLRNGEVRWTLSIEWPVPASEARLGSVISTVKESYPDAAVWQSGDSAVSLRVPSLGGVIRVSRKPDSNSFDFDVTADPDTEMMLLQLSDLHIAFRTADRNLDCIANMIGSLANTEMAGSTGKFTFKITFSEPNPYYGLFVRRLNLPGQELVTFNCTFIDRVAGRQENVQVTRRGVQFTTSSVVSMVSLARKYFALDPVADLAS